MSDKKNIPAVRFRGFHEEWESDILDNQVDFFTGLTYSPNDVSKQGTFVIRSSNIKENRLMKTDNVFVNSDVVNCEYVKKNDIVVVVRNGSRALIGKHAQLKEYESNTVIGAFMTGIRSEESNFTTALLDTNQFKSEINKNLGATINQITTGNFKNMEFGFPNSKPEQTKIGSFFENLDQLLTKHQTKHQKLQALKKAMLSKLFPKKGATTPEIRFKGFTQDWEVKTLGEICDFQRGRGLSWSMIDKKGINECILYGHLYTDYGMTINQINHFTNIGKKGMVLSKSGDVLIPGSDTTPTGLARASSLNLDNIILGGDINILRPNNNINGDFLSFNINANKQKLIKLIKGTSVKHIYNSDISKVSLHIPFNKKEQQQIGNYFKNLDALITKHAIQIEKLGAIKKACLSKMFV